MTTSPAATTGRSSLVPVFKIDTMKRLACFCFLLTLFVFSGCGGAPKSPYDPLKYGGEITYAGTPVVAGVNMHFKPAEGRVSTAVVGNNGVFYAFYSSTQDGVQKGKSRITFSWNKESRGEPSKEILPLLEKYGPESEGFEIDVQKADTKVKLEIPK